MKTRFFIFLIVLVVLGSAIAASAQVDSIFGQISSSNLNSFVGGTSGDGRIIVFESNGNVATENPDNTDRNREIFVFDYAQRRIYQITNTKSVLNNQTRPTGVTNTRVTIDNTRPVLSNDGRWIAFSSNATTSVSGSPVDGTNPGNFDGNTFTNSTSGGDILNVSEATGGETIENLIQPATPSVVTIRITDFNASITAFSVTVAGTDGGGATVSENFSFADGLLQTGTQVFTTVTSVTLDSIADASTTDTLDFIYGDRSNPLTADANTEMWLYQIPAVSPTELSSGEEIPPVDLSAGSFIQVTNTPASRLPVAGSNTQTPIIAADNSDPSISDDGNVAAFVSNRNLVGTGNESPENNPEIFTFVRASSTLSQVTETPRGNIAEPITNNVPSISGSGLRVMFASNADNPIVGMTGGVNTDLSEEIFYSDLSASGVPSGTRKQVTTTSPTNPGEVVNLVNFGRRMSRDGKYIAFDSFADLTNEHDGDNQTAFATFLYDADTDGFTRILARSDADEEAPGGDVARFPVFTDYVGGVPQTLVLGTRMNIATDGTIPANEEDGLNAIPQRPDQIYSYPLNETPENSIFTRQTLLPPPPFLLASIQVYPSDSLKRMAMTIPSAEIGTGNPDLSTEAYYLLNPDVSSVSPANMNFATGATNIPVTNEPVVLPSPTPTPSPSPSPDPTPQTPPAVQGLSRGMLATVNFDAGITQPVAARTAVGSLDRRFQLPIELSGVTMTIGGISVGLKRVSRRQIVFVVPTGLGSNLEFPFPVVINNNGVAIKGEIIIVPARPDIFRHELNPEANRAKVFNVTNRVHTREAFDVMTLKYRGGVKVLTELRLHLTGVERVQGSTVIIRIGDLNIQGTISNPVLIEPGIYTLDFRLSENLEMIGDQPIVISILAGVDAYTGRLDSDAPRVKIL